MQNQEITLTVTDLVTKAKPKLFALENQKSNVC